jgi:hypothetical protein
MWTTAGGSEKFCAVLGCTPGGVTPQSQGLRAILLRRALPAIQQSDSAPSPIFEMGSEQD